MPNKIHTVHGHVTGAQADGEQALGLLLNVVAGQELKVSDFTLTGDHPCWFWLATANDGTGHVYGYYLAAAGGIAITLDTPICLADGLNLYARYNTANVAGIYEVSFQGELLY